MAFLEGNGRRKSSGGHFFAEMALGILAGGISRRKWSPEFQRGVFRGAQAARTSVWHRAGRRRVTETGWPFIRTPNDREAAKGTAVSSDEVLLAAIILDRKSPVRLHQAMMLAVIKKTGVRGHRPTRSPIISPSCNCLRGGQGASSLPQPVVRVSKIWRLEVA